MEASVVTDCIDSIETQIDDLGYLDHDKAGRTVFVSIVEYLPESERDLHDVWKAHFVAGMIYFQTYEQLLRFDPEAQTFHIWKPSGDRFWPSLKVNDRLFVNDFAGPGLLEVVGDELVPVEGGELFASLGPYVALPRGDGEILFC